MDRTSKKSFLAGKRLSAKGSQSFFSFSHKILYIFFLSIISEAGFHKSSC
jgi:hypothetical protein